MVLFPLLYVKSLTHLKNQIICFLKNWKLQNQERFDEKSHSDESTVSVFHVRQTVLPGETRSLQRNVILSHTPPSYHNLSFHPSTIQSQLSLPNPPIPLSPIIGTDEAFCMRSETFPQTKKKTALKKNTFETTIKQHEWLKISTDILACCCPHKNIHMFHWDGNTSTFTTYIWLAKAIKSGPTLLIIRANTLCNSCKDIPIISLIPSIHYICCLLLPYPWTLRQGEMFFLVDHSPKLHAPNIVCWITTQGNSQDQFYLSCNSILSFTHSFSIPNYIRFSKSTQLYCSSLTFFFFCCSP